MISFSMPEGAAAPFNIQELVSGVTSAVAIDSISAAQGTPPAPPQSVLDSTKGNHTFTEPHRMSVWNSYCEQEFQSLVVRRAEGRITSDQRRRLDWLRSERQRLKNPVPVDQLIRDFRARELRSAALEHLQRYVDFIQGSQNHSQA